MIRKQWSFLQTLHLNKSSRGLTVTPQLLCSIWVISHSPLWHLWVLLEWAVGHQLAPTLIDLGFVFQHCCHRQRRKRRRRRRLFFCSLWDAFLQLWVEGVLYHSFVSNSFVYPFPLQHRHHTHPVLSYLLTMKHVLMLTWVFLGQPLDCSNLYRDWNPWPSTQGKWQNLQWLEFRSPAIQNIQMMGISFLLQSRLQQKELGVVVPVCHLKYFSGPSLESWLLCQLQLQLFCEHHWEKVIITHPLSIDIFAHCHSQPSPKHHWLYSGTPLFHLDVHFLQCAVNV